MGYDYGYGVGRCHSRRLAYGECGGDGPSSSSSISWLAPNPSRTSHYRNSYRSLPGPNHRHQTQFYQRTQFSWMRCEKSCGPCPYIFLNEVQTFGQTAIDRSWDRYIHKAFLVERSFLRRYPNPSGQQCLHSNIPLCSTAPRINSSFTHDNSSPWNNETKRHVSLCVSKRRLDILFDSGIL